MDKKELIEQLSDKEHASWARWMSCFLGKLKPRYVKHESGNVANILFNGHDLIIPASYLHALQKQIDTPYEMLTEQEKQYNRDEVPHILPIIEAYNDARIKEAIALLKEWKGFAYSCMSPMLGSGFDYIGRKRLTEKTDRFLESEGEKDKLLDEKQKKYIKLFLGDGHGKCTDGYLMTKLGLSDWDEAKKLIEQYEREGKNE